MFRKYIFPAILIISLVLLHLYIPNILLVNLNISNTKLTLGVTYWYSTDTDWDLYQNFDLMNKTGIKVIRIPLCTDITDILSNSYNLTKVFFELVGHYNFSVALMVSETVTQYIPKESVDFYFEKWGKYITYVQILNEPELLTGWTLQYPLIPEELYNLFTDAYNKVVNATQKYNCKPLLYTNFSPVAIIRSDVPAKLCPYLDFVGIDIYMEAGIQTFYYFYRTLQKMTNKPIIVAEFGYVAENKEAQKNFILSAIKTFQNLGITQAWIHDWGSSSPPYNYNIRDNTVLLEELSRYANS